MELIKRKGCGLILSKIKSLLVLFVHPKQDFLEPVYKLSTLIDPVRDVLNAHSSVLILLHLFIRVTTIVYSRQNFCKLYNFSQRTSNQLLELITDAHDHSTDHGDANQCQECDLPLRVLHSIFNELSFIVLSFGVKIKVTVLYAVYKLLLNLVINSAKISLLSDDSDSADS